MEKLKFISSETVKQFKASQNVDALDIKRNEKTGKLFFQYGGKTGAATAQSYEMPMVSLVQGTPDEKNPDGKFFLLHEAPTGGAPVIATL